MTHEKVLIPHEKNISEARINYNSHEASKTFFGPNAGWGVFEIKFEKKNSESFRF